MFGTKENGNWKNAVESKDEDESFCGSTEGPSLPSSHAQSPTPRRRSQSVASTHPSVETVVSKAKRAASTLWTLLHAQHCTIADACTHPGCKEAKLLLLHLKMCSAGSAFGCPTKHRGCEQARKLLAHYKRCKSIRAKQVGQSTMRRDAAEQHVCLVCNLVARQARSILERPRPPLQNSTAASASTRVRKASSRRIISSFMLDSSNRVVELPSDSLVQMPSPKMMPPPPPRAKESAEAFTHQLKPNSLYSAHSFPRKLDNGVISDVHTGRPVKSEAKAVSFQPVGRDRAYSQSDASMEHGQPAQRPRSWSLGTTLTPGAVTYAECGTILEEGESEPSSEFSEYSSWNPAA